MAELKRDNPHKLDFATIRKSLDAMLYTTGSRDALYALADLQVVQDRMASPDFPAGIQDGAFTAAELLIDTITRTYQEHRLTQCMAKVDENGNMETVEQQIQEDAASGNLELLSWSWLYYRYVRVDMDVRPGDYADIYGCNERTLRRYARNGVRRLTHILSRQEVLLYQQNRRRRLFGRLPVGTSPMLFGREHLLSHMNGLMEKMTPLHLQIIGEAGIGKTALVYEWIRRRISSDLLDEVIWIDRPDSYELMVEHIHDICIGNSRSQSVTEFAMRYRTIIVIDGSDVISQSQLLDLLQEYHAANIIFIEHSTRHLEPWIPVLDIPPLTEQASQAMLRYLIDLLLQGDDLSDEDVAIIHAQCNGSPGQMLALMQQLDMRIIS